MSEIRVGINGFGRIGRCLFKRMLHLGGFRVVGINDLADLDDLAYLLKYDSVHGWYPRKVEVADGGIDVAGQHIPFFAEKEPEKIPWGDLGAQVVIEATGVFRARDEAARHLKGGAERVIISAPSNDADGMFVLGVNGHDYDPDKHRVVSMASCTTNCLAPLAMLLSREYGVENLMFTTVHAYTSSQSLMDRPMRKRRRGRAAAVSIIPTTTGAAVATEVVLPELAGRTSGMAMRVPVPDGSITDVVATVNSDVTAEGVNEMFRKASSSRPLRGVLRVSDEALVSHDILGDPHSSIIDAESTTVLRGRTVKVLSWYDNEWGYSSRLVDFARLMVLADS